MTTSKTLCVNNKRFFHRYEITQKLPSLDPLAWLHSRKEFPKVYWKGRDGVEIAACGSVLTLTDIPVFDSGNDSPATFFGGHAFFHNQPPKDEIWSSFPRLTFFLPKFILTKEEGQLTGLIQAVNSPIEEDFPIDLAYFEPSAFTLCDPSHSPSSSRWKELIDFSLERIAGEEMKKVVVARRSSHNITEPLDPLEILSKLKAKGSIHFAYQFHSSSGFIGATPERLYRREGRKLSTEAIAGTRPRGKTPDEDKKLEQELFDTPKERREFDFVKHSIQEGLEPFCEKLSCELDDQIVKTPNVQHLHNPFQGLLKNGVGDDAILSALHPTAAMGGLPKSSALEHLLMHEPFERGWYASPLGYISQEFAEFAVGIRSALIEKDQLHLFAGTGIVPGSTAEQEWEELHHKTALWRNL